MPDIEQVRAASALLMVDDEIRGSAFLLSPSMAITAHHVVKNGGQLTLTYRGEQFRATVEAVDSPKDIAVLRLAKAVEGIQPLPYSFDSKRDDIGYIFGFPSGFGGAGIPLNVRIEDANSRIGNDQSLLLLSLSPNNYGDSLSGFSGAPVIVDDAVVGIVVRLIGEASVNFLGAVKIQDAIKILPRAEATRAIRKAQLGAHPVVATRADIGVIAALDEELDFLLDLPYDWSGPKPMEDGVTYRIGRMIDGAVIVAATANSMGMIDTAIVTTKLISAWSPRLIGMIGLCGGRKEKGVSIGDVIVPTQTFHYQFGAYKSGKLQKELRVENSDRQLLDIATYLSKHTDTLAKIRNDIPRGFPKPLTELRCHLGPMASADLVVKDADKIQEAVDADRKTIAVEMESYAFMKAAALSRVRWVLVAKSVSDFADADKSDDFRDYAKITSTRFFIEIARALTSTGLSDSAA